LPYVHANGIELYYEEQGQGEPVLLIPPTGWPGSVWQLGIAQPLCERYRVIVYDQRGIGLSEKPDEPYSTALFASDALALLQALDAEPAHVFGYSVGGQSAHLAAVRSPGSFRSLVLGAADISARSRGGGGFVPGNVALTMLDPGYNHPSYWMHHLGMEFTFSPEFRKKHPERIQRLAETIRERQAPAKPYVRHVIARTTHSSADQLSDIRVPTLVLVGAEDKEESGGGAVHVEVSRQIADQIPGARFETVPGARHLFPWEAPEATVQALLDFLSAI